MHNVCNTIVVESFNIDLLTIFDFTIGDLANGYVYRSLTSRRVNLGVHPQGSREDSTSWLVHLGSVLSHSETTPVMMQSCENTCSSVVYAKLNFQQYISALFMRFIWHLRSLLSLHAYFDMNLLLKKQ